MLINMTVRSICIGEPRGVIVHPPNKIVQGLSNMCNIAHVKATKSSNFSLKIDLLMSVFGALFNDFKLKYYFLKSQIF
jgi:hypothetical protein